MANYSMISCLGDCLWEEDENKQYKMVDFCSVLNSPAAKAEDDLKVHNHSSSSEPPSQQPLLFFEVLCKRSGKIRRFSNGTEAGFAVNLINKKLEAEGGLEISLASHIEAVKEGEEPVSFGPNSLLVDYGPGWKLQTVNYIQAAVEKGINIATRKVKRPDDKVIDDSNTSQKKSQASLSFVYIGKILLAFILILMFGAIFTLLLENLPELILYVNSLV
ncbi:uncharacterized protein LOC113775980 isoform X1 [Coffea eugenioides]|uniref:uncharacterized protein LOC113775980 isoform X1 n=1 Tax=Coffea eugenioides TaxID=49369 RepID=UPI000F60D54F|nr:uncharacterized protein LOC113775980 isoform X1 [Coffea eugenioides]